VIKILELCRENGFRDVEIMTSGNRLSDKNLVRRLAGIGINITFSLPIFSKDPIVHDSITQTPGSLQKVLKGLDNIKPYKNLDAIIHTNLLKQNLGSMEDLENS
jgi:MoaA/NifB/PqqE/SkfB family radical SAM enzyme